MSSVPRVAIFIFLILLSTTLAASSRADDDYSDFAARRKPTTGAPGTRRTRQSDFESRPVYFENCQCLTTRFDPHCGSDEKTYVDRCHFKCAQQNDESLTLIKRGRC